ncbi:unnamed protein product, partial [marine sediment metagenome]
STSCKQVFILEVLTNFNYNLLGGELDKQFLLLELSPENSNEYRN